jgi:predicted HicB family RNase H-like nuclease
MRTKLTLRLEDKLIEQAKSYATHAGISASQIVAEYFQLLACQKLPLLFLELCQKPGANF